ncbi:hypothetical protein LCGC14_0697600 [marine sediment metagenome]|uniref:Metallo-beta-lactamase domain-containing protein n=1 Tax=marine sediment metagenome TaxID=412755 RepID=A0A0F9QNJ0_9ZZZZ
MRINFLGTNGWYATSWGNTTSILINSEDYYILLDAGDGIQKIDQFIVDEKPIVLLLSHLHLDHTIGFHSFAKLSFTQDFNVYGYKGIKEGLENIIRHPYSSPFADLQTKIEIHELKEGNHNVGFPITCGLLDHADPCIGYRMEIEDKIVTYCTDTGLCPNLYSLSEDADLLITECSYKPGQEEWGWAHLKPQEAAAVAVESKVKKLILTHFDASIYKTIQDRRDAESVAQKTFKNTLAATDGLEIVIK